MFASGSFLCDVYVTIHKKNPAILRLVDLGLRELIADNIRAQIDKKQITVVAAAELAGMSREYLHRVLACEFSITVEKLVALAAALDVDPCVLISTAD